MTQSMSRENEERSFLEERRLGRELMFNDPNDKVPDTSSIRPAHVDQPIAPTPPLKAPQKASQKAWSPIPVPGEAGNRGSAVSTASP